MKPDWMTPERAAEVANACNEDIAGQLRKFEFVAAVQYWSCEAARVASEFATFKAEQILRHAEATMEIHNQTQ